MGSLLFGSAIIVVSVVAWVLSDLSARIPAVGSGMPGRLLFPSGSSMMKSDFEAASRRRPISVTVRMPGTSLFVRAFAVRSAGLSVAYPGCRARLKKPISTHRRIDSEAAETAANVFEIVLGSTVSSLRFHTFINQLRNCAPCRDQIRKSSPV